MIILAILTISLLSACGSKSVDLMDYVEVSFEGVDSLGRASYSVDIDGAIAELYDLSPEPTEAEMAEVLGDPDLMREIERAYDSYEISLDKDENLSNGDTVTVIIAVDEEKSKGLKGGEKEFTVEGLQEPEVITTEEVEKHIVIDFIGSSGRGRARVENTFNNELSSLEFEVENDGQLTNGDQVTLAIDEEFERELLNEGYKLEDGFNPTYEVKGLNVFAEKAEDIKNLDDIKRMIEEEAKRDYNENPEWNFEAMYKLKEELFMYRQFDEENNDSGWSGDESTDGALVGVYSVEEYNNKEDKELQDEFIYIVGFNNTRLDDNNEVNVSKMNKISDVKDNTYSLETVIQLYEGRGFEKLSNQ